MINETNSSNDSEHSTRLNFLVYLYIDVEKLINALPSFLQMVQSKVKDDNVTISKLLEGNRHKDLKIILYYYKILNLSHVDSYFRFSR